MVEQDTMWDSWHNLPESVISGRPSHRLDDPKRGAEFFPNLIRSLHAISWGPAKRAAQALCHEKSAGELLVLDIACGSGVWGIAIAETNRKALVTAQDFPIILNETRKYVDARKLGRRYSYLPGNLNEVDFGTLSFDVAVLGHILHIEGEVSARRLFRRLHRALRPGGRIVIAEMIPNDSRTGPQFAIFFALNMLLNTARGDTYTLSEYRTWLMRAGFIGVRTLNVGSHSPLIVARKPE
jgi:ubiquinone/menaquinone biosynthesis C-methylase UbiE